MEECGQAAYGHGGSLSQGWRVTNDLANKHK
jgi:hypothetical protein